jgi:hypothetical protein
METGKYRLHSAVNSFENDDSAGHFPITWQYRTMLVRINILGDLVEKSTG